MTAIYACLATLAVIVTADFYNPRYDEFDVQPLLENDRILISYTNCFLEQGPCTPEAKDFKKVIPEALETNCEKCSPKQRELIRLVVRAVIERHPKAWEELNDQYDKDRKYKETFHKFIAGTD